jgi:hypothetical protein
MQVAIYDPVTIRSYTGSVAAQAISQVFCNVIIAIITVLARENLERLKIIFSQHYK